MIRNPAVAGMFYPADPHRLQAQIQQMLAQSDPPPIRPKALIVPHAGYIYSGQVAAQAYRLLQQYPQICRVVLLGPAHRVYVPGLAVSSATAYTTPLGTIPVAVDAVGEILGLSQVQVSDLAHAPEHSLEVQLPFLQSVLENFQLVPILVGDADAPQTAAVIEQLWGDDGTLILVSSDLSHFHPYREAQQIDRATGDAILRMSEALVGEQACGCHAINGLMHSARQHRMKITELAICNSGDTAGDKERVVGYGAYALH